MLVRGLEVTDLLAMEYEQLKLEQRQRIAMRDNLLYATLGSYAVVVAGALQVQDIRLILLLPLVCLILGWTYYINDNRITAIGRYIETVIVPPLTPDPAAGWPIFAWERAHRSERGRWFRKIWQTGVDLTAFILPIFLAVAIAGRSMELSPLVMSVLAIEAFGGAMLGMLILVHAVRAARRT